VTRIVVGDIGGTNARFALADIDSDGAITLGEQTTLRTSSFVSFKTAWEAFAHSTGSPLPKAAAIAIAAPVTSGILRMTNNSWTIDTAAIEQQLGLDRFTVLNDFAAVAHAAARASEDHLAHLAGPEMPLPARGTISVLGPGTGLGVAQFHRFADGGYHVQPTEGGHIDFAPIDAIDDAILARLRKRHRRVSVERVVSGPGIVDIYEALAAIEDREIVELPDGEIWKRGEDRTDALAVAAVERFCMSLGSAAGDYALAHGAAGVVIAGGVGLRLHDRLRRSSFAERFGFKGRYESLMAGLPVKLITHPQPGLFGAAAAFAKEHCRS
jgi:glucokinase